MADLAFWGGPENPQPYFCLEVDHTLFHPGVDEGDGNTQLHTLNQPLLEQTLRSWEERLGTIRDVEGLTGIFRYGYVREQQREH
jgi:hypothetical protein